MKTNFNHSILTALSIFLMLGSSNTLFAQKGKVLAKISDVNSLGIVTDNNSSLNVTNTELKSLVAKLSITSIEKAFPASRSKELQNVYEITCQCDENDLLTEISKNTRFFQAPELTQAPEALYIPNDYSLAITNDYALNLINAQGAWDITHGDSSIVIAITDANYHYGHEELVGKYNYVGANPSTDYVHGTAVAITAAGKTNNGIGKSSIGFNSSLQLRAMNYNEVLAASYAGAKVINMSWAGSCYFVSYYQQVMDEAYTNGSVLVAAAGNGGTCNGANNFVYPASYNHVISVSSVGPYDNHERTIGNPATTHQHNNMVDICAPGYDVALSTAPGVYLTGNGTSFASPIVSGTVALMLSVNPCLTSDEIELILKQTAVNIDAMNPAYIGKLGAGRLNAAAAVQMAATYSTMYMTGEVAFNCATMEQSIVLDLSNVAAPYQISWNTGDTAQSLMNVTPGNYMAVVRDSNGCVGVYAPAVDTLVPISITADIHHALCKGDDSGAIEIEVSGGHSYYTYQWSTYETSQDINGLTSGSYHVTVTDAKGCQTSEVFEVNEPELLSTTVSHQDAVYLNSGAISVTVSGGTLPYAYTWSNGQTSEDLEGLTEGFYELLVTDANGCLASANAIVKRVAVTENGSSTTKGDDASITGGIHYSGKSMLRSSALGLDDFAESSVQVYPNPATEQTYVVSEGENFATVQLVTMAGQTLQTTRVESNKQAINLIGFAKGDYFLVMTTENGEQRIEKLIIQ
jgi:hypothetical protein